MYTVNIISKSENKDGSHDVITYFCGCNVLSTEKLAKAYIKENNLDAFIYTEEEEDYDDSMD